LELPRKQVLSRMRSAAEALQEAISNKSDPATVRDALARMYWKYVSSPQQTALANSAAALSARKPITTDTLGLKPKPVIIPPTPTYEGELRVSRSAIDNHPGSPLQPIASDSSMRSNKMPRAQKSSVRDANTKGDSPSKRLLPPRAFRLVKSRCTFRSA